MASAPSFSGGWSPALVLYHVSMWRDVLLGSLRELQQGRPPTPPPDSVDAFNAQHLTGGTDLQLKSALDRADQRLSEMIALWEALGDQPFPWYVARTVGEALVRNSYYHPRNHIAEHYLERGDRARATAIYEETAAELRKAQAPAHILNPAVENLTRSKSFG
jgi:hypothetical protein